jgi:hypothetical protein
MGTFNKTKLLILAGSVLSILFLIQCSEIIDPEKSYTNRPDQVILADNENCGMTDQEKADLLYMREEEKLSRDIYNYLDELWGTAIFAKIALSEQHHMDAIKRMIDKHKMTDIDPVIIQPEEGFFVNEEIQKLYDDLAEKGLNSEIAALEVGVEVENINIAILNEFLDPDRLDNQDIINVYQNILQGSKYHLSSFESLLPLPNTDE